MKVVTEPSSIFFTPNNNSDDDDRDFGVIDITDFAKQIHQQV